MQNGEVYLEHTPVEQKQGQKHENDPMRTTITEKKRKNLRNRGRV